MTCCEVCTGRHLTSACVIARRWVDECAMGTPDEYHVPIVPLNPPIDELAARRWAIKMEQDRRSSASRNRKRRLRLVS